MSTPARVTFADLEARAQLVSSALRDGLHVVVEHRGMPLGVDLDLHDSSGYVRKLASDLTMRRAHEYLGAMIETLTIVGRDVVE
jgi:hypothetical protein